MSSADSLAGGVLVLCGLNLVLGIEGDPGYMRSLNLAIDPKGFGAVFTLLGVWILIRDESGVGRRMVSQVWKYSVPIVLMSLAFSLLGSDPALPYSTLLPVVLGDFRLAVVSFMMLVSIFSACCILYLDRRGRYGRCKD